MIKNTKLPLVGAHVSVSGGLFNAPVEGEKIGAECLQIFIGSPRRYEVKNLSPEEVLEYKLASNKLSTGPVFVHASYLINLASEDVTIQQKSVDSLINLLKATKQIGAFGAIYHPGSPKGGDKKKAILREIESLKKVLNSTPPESNIIIENTAGAKKIGTNEEEIGFMLNSIGSQRMKVCIDTAHALESGNIINFSKEAISEWVCRWDLKVDFENIIVLHVNDSLTAPNSNHDRHANIGEGHIGKQGFANLMSFKEFQKTPWLLEVPGFGNNGPDKKNIDILKKLRNNMVETR